MLWLTCIQLLAHFMFFWLLQNNLKNGLDVSETGRLFSGHPMPGLLPAAGLSGQELLHLPQARLQLLFSLDTMKKISTENVEKKKKLSLSSIPRNTRRRQDFLENKCQITPVRSAPAANDNKKTPQRTALNQLEIIFKCDNCDLEFETKKGLRCHEGKKA